MSFIAKNPISAVEITSLPPVPIKGTRGIFAKKDGWYDIDSSDNINKIATIKDINELLADLDDGININVDTELSETSENAVQNKVITAELKKKVTAVNGKGLSTNDFTDEDKIKLTGIEVGANKTVVDTELSSTSTNPIQNKAVAEAVKDMLSQKTQVQIITWEEND